MHGVGLFSWRDGRTFHGGYDNDKKHGYGVFSWADGSSCRSSWCNGLQHGQGTMTNVAGVARSAMWKEGVFQGWMEASSAEQPNDGCLAADSIAEPLDRSLSSGPRA
eukprot:NODE_18645_length_883_cov_3.629630.p2 GENE.NODE_18645_length_883_cov_3.629630~~NODE_18645_length_883_cov_3.629630.p2  ORF type:complete len:107 (-),score=17.28 NODE_18645_length_883_cov_3.629630:7-327(-)